MVCTSAWAFKTPHELSGPMLPKPAVLSGNRDTGTTFPSRSQQLSRWRPLHQPGSWNEDNSEDSPKPTQGAALCFILPVAGWSWSLICVAR
ncbi:uncharacterized protein AAG666_016805 isoform 4-T5 [Megaptera novaeangliae]